MKIGLIGLNHVGSALQKSFYKKKIDCIAYDKEKNIGNLESCLFTDILFLCPPIQFDSVKKVYDKEILLELCQYLSENDYKGIVVIKSSIEPTTTEHIAIMFSNLSLVYHPEFLSTTTPYHDFHNQKHVVIGAPSTCTEDCKRKIQSFYQKYYPQAKISHCHSTESETMKHFCHSFYAVKHQFFTELQHLCREMNCSYENIRTLMLKNNWIHPIYTSPFTESYQSHDIDSRRSRKKDYCGFSLSNDMLALLSFMKENTTNHKILSATIQERSGRFSSMQND